MDRNSCLLSLTDASVNTCRPTSNHNALPLRPVILGRLNICSSFAKTSEHHQVASGMIGNSCVSLISSKTMLV
jgi:hypothetical protein